VTQPTNTFRSNMPYLYFGFEPRNRGATKLAVKTDSGELEPAEPSKVKVFSQVPYVPIWSLFVDLLGLAVAILSFPKFSYVAMSRTGLQTKAAPANIPMHFPGLAVVLKKGVSLSTSQISLLEDENFSSMQYNGRTVWLKDVGTREAFMKVDTIGGVDPTGPCPARYLNTHSFRAFLVLRSFTTRVCELFHYLTLSHSEIPTLKQYASSISADDGWTDVSGYHVVQDAGMASNVEFKFKNVSVFKLNSGSEKTINSMCLIPGANEGISSSNSGALFNPLDKPQAGYLLPGDMSSIKSPGVIFKFNTKLALSDPNLVGDVIGRHFLAGLGDSHDDQLENLELIKTGIAGLRLTRVGEELTHLYKCIEIAIEAKTGCVPIYSKKVYEGCVLMGGSSIRNFIIGGRSYPMLSVTELKNELLNVSDHASSLNYISTLFPEEDKTAVKNTTSMYDLRELCLSLICQQDIRDEIIRKAALLDYGVDSWVISPVNLKSCFDLISSFSALDQSYPIGRMSLFSKDAVLVALSCFGEKTAPSWDIPNGVNVSLKKANPPSPLVDSKKKKGSKGNISDAAWVMVIRQTDLFSAVEEFKKMASTLVYRSSSSELARRVGHRVFSRDRMAEFWKEMREALRVVNPLAAFESDEGNLKRGATDSSSLEQGTPGAPKRRRMDF